MHNKNVSKIEISSSFMYRLNLYSQNLNCEDEGDEDVRDNGRKERK